MAEALEGLGDAFSGDMFDFGSIGDALPEALPDVTDSFSGIGDSLSDTFGGAGDAISGTFDDAPDLFDGVGDTFGDASDKFAGAFDGAGEAFENTTASFSDGASVAFDGAKSSIAEIPFPENSVSKDVGYWVPEEAPLSPELSKMAADQRDAASNLYKGYGDIAERAAAGEKITGADFDAVEQPLNQAMQGQAVKINDAIGRQVAGIKEADTPAFRADYQKELNSRFGNTANVPPPEQLKNVAPLNSAFREQYVAGAPKENVSINPKGLRQEQLVTELLKQNPGVAIADMHTQSEASNVLTGSVREAKASGVNLRTIYTELDHESFEKYSKLTEPQLRELIETGRTEGVTLQTAEQRSVMYAGSEADASSPKAIAQNFLAARENGVEVVNIDKSSAARAFESGIRGSEGSHRIASTNYQWTDNINAHRAASGLTPEDKYILFAGQNHLTKNGMVDEALGIPVVAVTQGGPEQGIVRGINPDGADYYVPGGADYENTLAQLDPEVAEQVKAARMSYLNQVGQIPAGLTTPQSAEMAGGVAPASPEAIR